MNTTNTIQSLQSQVEQLVRAHMAAYEREVTAAVQRAFASASKPGQPSRSRPARRAQSRRRGPEEVATLAERLHAAVCEHPGERMKILAVEVGESARALQRPMFTLKKAERVRSMGERDRTRYFPMAAGEA